MKTKQIQTNLFGNPPPKKYKSKPTQFNKEKKQLHQYHKKIKTGIIRFENTPKKIQNLLIKYFGY